MSGFVTGGPAPSSTSPWLVLTCRPPATLVLARSLTAAGQEAWSPSGWVQRRRRGRNENCEHEVPLLPTFVFVRTPEDRPGQQRHAEDLYRIANAPTSPHPAFAIFGLGRRSPVISSASLDPLRLEQGIEMIKSEMRADREQERQIRLAAEAEREAALRALRKQEAIDRLAKRRQDEEERRARRARQEADLAALRAQRAAAPKLNPGDLVTSDRSALRGLVGVVQGMRGSETLVLFGGSHAFKIETWLLHPARVETATAA